MRSRRLFVTLSIVAILLCASYASASAQTQCYCNGQTQTCQWGCSRSGQTTSRQNFNIGNISVNAGKGGLTTVTVALTPTPGKCAAATQRPQTTLCVPTRNPSATPTSTSPTGATPRPTNTSATATPRPSQPVQTSAPSTGSSSADEQSALRYMNEDRVKNGLAELPMDPQLQRIARMKSQDMADNNYFSHTSPTYGSASQMLKDQGYSFTSVAENIAHHASILKAQAAFMSSEGHRRNILGSQWTKVGIGVAYDKNGYPYVTQLFVR